MDSAAGCGRKLIGRQTAIESLSWNIDGSARGHAIRQSVRYRSELAGAGPAVIGRRSKQTTQAGEGGGSGGTSAGDARSAGGQ